MSEFSDLQRQTYQNSADHGFWAPERSNPYEKLALIHSEVSEALEAIRTGALIPAVWYREDGKPEGVGPELADVVIRCMDLAEASGIDLWERIVEKHEFNKTRPFMHGKQA